MIETGLTVLIVIGCAVFWMKRLAPRVLHRKRAAMGVDIAVAGNVSSHSACGACRGCKGGGGCH